jgi:hypothetical protein
MPISNQLDLTVLLAPIPGNNPAGTNIPFGVKDQLEQMFIVANQIGRHIGELVGAKVNEFQVELIVEQITW